MNEIVIVLGIAAATFLFTMFVAAPILYYYDGWMHRRARRKTPAPPAGAPPGE